MNQKIRQDVWEALTRQVAIRDALRDLPDGAVEELVEELVGVCLVHATAPRRPVTVSIGDGTSRRELGTTLARVTHDTPRGMSAQALVEAAAKLSPPVHIDVSAVDVVFAHVSRDVWDVAWNPGPLLSPGDATSPQEPAGTFVYTPPGDTGSQ